MQLVYLNNLQQINPVYKWDVFSIECKAEETFLAVLKILTIETLNSF